jgi:predicted RNA-binding Zn-ribbon protein involved in translation (DUF1610 family)
MVRRAFTIKLHTEIDEKFIRIIEQQENFQNYFYDILTSYINGDLERAQTEENLKRKKMQVDIKFKEVCTAIKEKELLHWNTFDKTPSYQAKKAITKAEKNRDLETVQVSAYDEKNHRFMCPECGNCFVFAEDQRDIGESKENFIDHYFQKHGEIPKSLEHELRELS